MIQGQTGPAPEAPTPWRGSLLGPGVVVAAGMAVGQVLGYALAVLGARLLGPATFGELSALTGLLVIGGVVPLAVQTVAARRVAAGDEGSDGSTLVRLGLLTGAAVTLVGLLVVPLAVVGLRLGPLSAALVAATLLPMTLSSAGIGRAQGQERFIRLGWLYAVLALGRSGLAVAVLVATRSVLATMLAGAVGATLSWIVINRSERLPWLSSAVLPRSLRTETWHTTHALLAMFVFTNTDLLLARHSLTPEDAGAYAAGAIVIKVAFWLPQAVAVVVFPRLAEGRSAALGKGVAVVLALGLAVTLGAALLGPVVLPALIGNAYPAVVSQSWLFGLAGTAEAVAYLVLFSRLAAEDRGAAVAVWGAVVVLAVVVLTVAHGSPAQIAGAVTAVATGLCLVGLVANRRGVEAPSTSAA